MMTFKFPVADIEELTARIKNLGSGLKRDEADAVGRVCVNEMLRAIAGGDSPIVGGGLDSKFAAYKNPQKYPGKRKAHSPVNLKLSGRFLSDLGHVVVQGVRGYTAVIGYKSGLSTLKESGHREGVHGQPARPTIPDHTRGEDFAPQVKKAFYRLMLDAFRKR